MVALRDYMCDCEPYGGKRSIDRIFPFIDKLPNKEGKLLCCGAFTCSRCGKVFFAPSDNWRKFLEQGPTDVVEEWERRWRREVGVASDAKAKTARLSPGWMWPVLVGALLTVVAGGLVWNLGRMLNRAWR